MTEATLEDKIAQIKKHLDAKNEEKLRSECKVFDNYNIVLYG